jgi:hypothetical protein
LTTRKSALLNPIELTVSGAPPEFTIGMTRSVYVSQCSVPKSALVCVVEMSGCGGGGEYFRTKPVTPPAIAPPLAHPCAASRKSMRVRPPEPLAPVDGFATHDCPPSTVCAVVALVENRFPTYPSSGVRK